MESILQSNIAGIRNRYVNKLPAGAPATTAIAPPPFHFTTSRLYLVTRSNQFNSWLQSVHIYLARFIGVFSPFLWFLFKTNAYFLSIDAKFKVDIDSPDIIHFICDLSGTGVLEEGYWKIIIKIFFNVFFSRSRLPCRASSRNVYVHRPPRRKKNMTLSKFFYLS